MDHRKNLHEIKCQNLLIIVLYNKKMQQTREISQQVLKNITSISTIKKTASQWSYPY